MFVTTYILLLYYKIILFLIDLQFSVTKSKSYPYFAHMESMESVFTTMTELI